MRKLKLKPGMNFLWHALCARGCTPHKSAFAPQGDVWHPTPRKKNFVTGKRASYKYYQEIGSFQKRSIPHPEEIFPVRGGGIV